MLTRLKRVPRDAAYAREVIPVPIDAGDGLSDEVVAEYVPGYPFQIVNVQHFFPSASDASYDVEIDGVSALDEAAEPEEGEHGTAVLADDFVPIRGGMLDSLSVAVTTGGSGVLKGTVFVTIRPIGLRGD